MAGAVLDVGRAGMQLSWQVQEIVRWRRLVAGQCRGAIGIGVFLAAL